MPSSPWVSFQIRPPAALSTLGSAVSDGLSSVKTRLQVVQAKARIAAALATNPSDITANGLNLAIKATVAAAEAAVGELLDDTGAYLLVVPVPKKGFVQLAPSSASDAPGSTFFSLPLPNLIEQLPEAEQARLRNTSVFEQLTDASQVYRGGNAYFINTVGESMFDPRDSSRPKFANTDYWAYAVFVGGARDVAAVLPLAAYFERLLGNVTHHGPTRGLAAVVPQNVRATPSGRERMAVVEWQPVDPSRVLISFDDAVVRPVQYVIIRSKDFRVATATTVGSIFGTDELAIGDEGRFGAKVVDIVNYDGITARWVDRSELASDTDYYYLIGFKCRVANAETPWLAEGDDTPLDLPYDKLVCAGPVRIRNGAAPLSRGKMPDWTRVPSFATIFPPVERFLDSSLERLRSIAAASQTLTDVNDYYVQALEAEVNRYATLAGEFLRDVESVTKLLTLPSSVAGVAMKTGTGNGNASAFLGQLMRDFSDLSDPERPAFDAGDEYVTGFVVLAVGPDPVAIAKQLSIFELLFGSPETNELLAGVNSIADSIPALTAAVEAAEAAANTFNDDMTPRAVGQGDATCDPVVGPEAPVFDPSMRPTES